MLRDDLVLNDAPVVDRYEWSDGITQPRQWNEADHPRHIAWIAQQRRRQFAPKDGMSSAGTQVQSAHRPGHIINQNLASHVDGQKQVQYEPGRNKRA